MTQTASRYSNEANWFRPFQAHRFCWTLLKKQEAETVFFFYLNLTFNLFTVFLEPLAWAFIVKEISLQAQPTKKNCGYMYFAGKLSDNSAFLRESNRVTREEEG